MDARGRFYEFTEEEKAALLGEPTKVDEADVAKMREDAARLEGYLKGRADSDRPHRERSNSDLTRRRQA